MDLVVSQSSSKKQPVSFEVATLDNAPLAWAMEVTFKTINSHQGLGVQLVVGHQ